MADKSKEECAHETINFGSGDYYLFCHGCNRVWVMTSWDSPDHPPRPDLANKGVGAQLSGQARSSIKNGERA